MRLNPYHPEWYWTNLGSVLYEARKYADAAEAFGQITRPGYWIFCRLAGCYAQLGQMNEARAMEANASRYHGKAPDELDWTEKQRQKRAVAEYLAALEAEAATEGNAADDGADGGLESKRQRQPPKVISPSDPQSACATTPSGALSV